MAMRDFRHDIAIWKGMARLPRIMLQAAENPT
jgi:hypothetical protein